MKQFPVEMKWSEGITVKVVSEVVLACVFSSVFISYADQTLLVLAVPYRPEYKKKKFSV